MVAATCENCGRPRAESDAFCGYCGASASHSGPLPAMAQQSAGRVSEEARTVVVDVVRPEAASPDAESSTPPDADAPASSEAASAEATAVPAPDPVPEPVTMVPSDVASRAADAEDAAQVTGAAPPLLGGIAPIAAPQASYAPPPEPPQGPPPLGGVPPAMPSPPLPRAVAASLARMSPAASYYLGQRLLYEQVPEYTFDPLYNWRFYLALLRQAGTFGVVYLVGGVLSGLVLGIGSLVVPFLGILWIIGAVVVWIGLFIAYLLIPVPALLSEWKILVDDQGPAWQAALGQVYYALQRRQTPLDSAGIRRLNLPGGEARDYLELKREVFTGYVSCFPHGNDLYVGWTFWLRLTPGRLLLRYFQWIWRQLTFRGNDLYDTLRYESAKAMRDAMHGAAHEATEAVVTGSSVAQAQAGYQGLSVSTTQLTSLSQGKHAVATQTPPIRVRSSA